jgi:hypothetical protein
MVLRSEHAHQSWIHRRFATVSPAVRAAIIHSTLARKPMENIACILLGAGWLVLKSDDSQLRSWARDRIPMLTKAVVAVL